MLFDDLREVLRQIGLIDPQKDGPLFANEVLRHNPAAFRKLGEAGSQPGVRKLVMAAVGAGCIKMLIMPLPDIVQQMAEVVRAKSERADIRCTLAGALGYLVKRSDLIPDDAPGGGTGSLMTPLFCTRWSRNGKEAAGHAGVKVWILRRLFDSLQPSARRIHSRSSKKPWLVRPWGFSVSLASP